MRRPTTLIAILAAALALAAGAAPAGASTTDRIIQDCQHSPTGELTGTYPRKALQRALHNLPGDVSEYSGCYDAINQALLDAAIRPPGGGDGGGGGGPSGSDLPGGLAPPGGGSGGTGPGGAGAAGGADGAAPPQHTGSKTPVAVDGGLVRPGAIPAIGRDAHALPGPLVVLLVLLGIGALAPAATTIGRRVIARRRA